MTRLRHPPQTDRVLILLVCPNEDRLNRLKGAVHSAGFRTISARALDEAWAKTDFFDFGAVMIEELTNLFSRGSELVQ